METVTTLDDKVRAFKVLLDKKDELAEQTKANNEEIKNLEQEIAQQMVDEEKPDTTVDGFKYSLQEKNEILQDFRRKTDGKRSGILRCLERAGIRTHHHGKSRSTNPRLCDEQSGGRERWRTAGRNGRGTLRLFGT